MQFLRMKATRIDGGKGSVAKTCFKQLIFLAIASQRAAKKQRKLALVKKSSRTRCLYQHKKLYHTFSTVLCLT